MFLFFLFTIAFTIVSPLFVIGVKRNRNAGSSSVRRRSDGAQSRVKGMLLRVDAIVRISNCLNGFLDFLLPSYIQSFLLLYPKFRVVSPSSSADEREQLLPYKRHLGSIVKKRLSAAVNRRDRPTILRFIKLCKPLGLEEEGLRVFVRYLKEDISKRSRDKIKQLVQQLMGTPNNDSEVDFVGCLRDVLLEIVLAIEQNDEILRDLRGDDGIVHAICDLQKGCDIWCCDILEKFIEYRELPEHVTCILSYMMNMERRDLDPVEIDACLQEILSFARLHKDYTEQMVSKIESLSNPELGRRAREAVMNGHIGVASWKMTHDYYVSLERLLMKKGVEKAIRIAEREPHLRTSTMVDDVFYHVLYTSCRRAISTRNINWFIKVLDTAVKLLRDEYSDAVFRVFRDCDVGEMDDIYGDNRDVSSDRWYAQEISPRIAKRCRQEIGIEIVTALNNLEVSSEHALKFRRGIEEEYRQAFPTSDFRKSVEYFSSQLDGMSSRFKNALDVGMEQVMATVTTQIKSVLKSISVIRPDGQAIYDVNNHWAESLINALKTKVAWLEPLMTATNYDTFVYSVIRFIVSWIPDVILALKFSEDGLEQLPSAISNLASHLSSMTERPIENALDVGMEQLVATVESRIRQVLGSVKIIPPDGQATYDEANRWGESLIYALKIYEAWLKPLLTATSYDTFASRVIVSIVRSLLDIIMPLRFSESGREQLRREISELDSHLSGMTQGPIENALDAEMEQLVATVTSQIEPVLQSMKTIGSYGQEIYDEANHWVQCLVNALEIYEALLKPLMVANYHRFAHPVIDFILRRLLKIVTSLLFSEGGREQFPGEIRKLAVYLQSMTWMTNCQHSALNFLGRYATCRPEGVRRRFTSPKAFSRHCIYKIAKHTDEKHVRQAYGKDIATSES